MIVYILGDSLFNISLGGQYDSVGYRQCGKEPYSGVDKKKHPKYKDYIEQAGNSKNTSLYY